MDDTGKNGRNNDPWGYARNSHAICASVNPPGQNRREVLFASVPPPSATHGGKGVGVAKVDFCRIDWF